MSEGISVFSRRLRTPDGFSSKISSRAAPPEAADLAGRVGFLMISIKNRLFTSSLIKAYCRFATEQLLGGCVTVVDRPYVYNVLAASHERSARRTQISAIRRLGEERRRQAAKLISKYDEERIEFVSWNQLAMLTPKWLWAEVRTAFRNKGKFHSDLLEQTQLNIGGPLQNTALESYARFLVEETPVLLYCYYMFRGGIVDVYPGEIADYFWRLERGDYARELPQTTALATTHAGLIYVDFRQPAPALT
jgi:hypothetical protein